MRENQTQKCQLTCENYYFYLFFQNLHVLLKYDKLQILPAKFENFLQNLNVISGGFLISVSINYKCCLKMRSCILCEGKSLKIMKPSVKICGKQVLIYILTAHKM